MNKVDNKMIVYTKLLKKYILMKKVDLPAGARPMKTNQIIAVSHVAFIE